MRRLLMRVFSAELRSSFLPWAKVGPLKGPRSRWIGIPRYPEHRHWPTALRDADQLVKHCNGCQRFSKHWNTPAAALKTIPLTWPFTVWGLDMVGPFKTAPGGLTHLLVAVDKFTKWIEAKPIKKLDGSSTIKFFNEIITRYGVTDSIIIDNGTNFAKEVFAEYCGQ
jgi:hypothetical protein